MHKIINEFFSKESKKRNITITSLLQEYKVEEKLFWNYVYNYHLNFVEKIKQENKKREDKIASLEIYRLTKDGNLTFGEIAHQRGITVEEVIALLQNEYLTGLAHYSFDSIKKQNTNLLRQKKEFQLYFYFVEHDVTFEQLGKQFGLEESQIICYFYTVLNSELSKNQIKGLFLLNKNRERKIEYNQNKQKLCDLFILTEEEIQYIDELIRKFEMASPQFYKKE